MYLNNYNKHSKQNVKLLKILKITEEKFKQGNSNLKSILSKGLLIMVYNIYIYIYIYIYYIEYMK